MKAETVRKSSNNEELFLNIDRKNNNLLNYVFQTFKHPFTTVKFTYSFTKEI
jgi:hypothetical protein